MRFVIQMILIAAAAYLLDLFLPWYSIAIAAFVISIFVRSASNFLAGFLGVGLLWFITAWFIDSDAASNLAERVSHILPVNNKMMLMLLTATIGALVAGCAATAGASVRKERRRY